MTKLGTGHPRQQSLFKTKWRHRFSHGGTLRQKRAGRGQRPLSSREPLHLVFKINKKVLRSRSLRFSFCFAITLQIFKKYSRRFLVKIEQLSVQHDHIHVLIRASQRRNIQYFFRVVAGQLAQRLEKQGLLLSVTGTARKGTKLWLHRPFSRIIRGWRAYEIVRKYIQLNELEVTGKISYKKGRLRGLSSGDWQLLSASER